MESTARAVNSIRNPASAQIVSKAQSIRVLVVDDEPAIVEFVTCVLESAGYQTGSAGDGPEALLVAARSGPFDLLLTDLKMPDMNGDELARRLRVDDPRLKVLYFAGFGDERFKERLTLWGDEVYLDKPATVSGILETVALLLKRAPAEPEQLRLENLFHRHRQ